MADEDYSKIFILNGYAGTGKTTLISAFVAAMKDLGIRCVLLAPTGRAAKVLAHYSSQTAYTIHKKIYRERTTADYESKFSLDINRDRNTVYIVDEASMLSSGDTAGSPFGSGDLLGDLMEYVRRGHECRLILVGDDAQLPRRARFQPCARTLRAALPYGEVEYAVMDEVVRQNADSGHTVQRDAYSLHDRKQPVRDTALRPIARRLPLDRRRRAYGVPARVLRPLRPRRDDRHYPL